jgi:hypothetical protein
MHTASGKFRRERKFDRCASRSGSKFDKVTVSADAWPALRVLTNFLQACTLGAGVARLEPKPHLAGCLVVRRQIMSQFYVGHPCQGVSCEGRN